LIYLFIFENLVFFKKQKLEKLSNKLENRPVYLFIKNLNFK
jgi:hypothetical protein